MDLRHLRYFVAVAEEGHFGRAAQRLNIVQPALSMQIKSLEDEIGGLLFTRTSRRVELTEAGALLLIEAQRTLAQAERAKSIVQRSLRGEIGLIKIGFVGNAVLTGKLMADLDIFHRTYPGAEIELHEMAPHLQQSAILSGEIDIGYSPGLALTLDSLLTSERVGMWPLLVAIASNHPLAEKTQLSAKLLATYPLILYAGEGTESGPLTLLHKLTGIEPLAAYRISSTLGVLALAAAGLGVAMVPAPLINVSIPNIIYRPLEEPEMAADLVVISRANETNGAVKSFLALARMSVDQ